MILEDFNSLASITVAVNTLPTMIPWEFIYSVDCISLSFPKISFLFLVSSSINTSKSSILSSTSLYYSKYAYTNSTNETFPLLSLSISKNISSANVVSTFVLAYLKRLLLEKGTLN